MAPGARDIRAVRVHPWGGCNVRTPRRPRALLVLFVAAIVFGAACAGEQPKHLGMAGNAALAGDGRLAAPAAATTPGSTAPSAATAGAGALTATGTASSPVAGSAS